MAAGPFILPGPRARAKARGERNRNAGAAFEKWLEGQHRVARQFGVARVRKVSPAVEWIGKGPAAAAKVVGENGADYVGRLRGGRSITAEAKSTTEDRLPRSAFEKHQIEDLDEASDMGALSLALIELRDPTGHPRRFAVEWGTIAWRWRGEGASVGLPELAGCEIDAGVLYLLRFVAS